MFNPFKSLMLNKLKMFSAAFVYETALIVIVLFVCSERNYNSERIHIRAQQGLRKDK